MYFELKNIDVFYGNVKILKDISINLKQGEILSLLGANGAGKTTLLKTICGLVKNKSGEIWFNGNRIDEVPSNERVSLGISMVPEERHIFPYMSVMDNLLMGAYSCKNSKKIKINIDRIHKLFPRLKERAKQMGGSLSGGEQQMLAVARGMMSNPKLILLDEPSLGLAPIVVKEIFEIIKILNKEENISVILVEQNTKMALKFSQRAYVIELGNIALEGNSNELVNDKRVKELYLGG